MDCSLPGSSVHGIFQARVLEWGAIAFSTHGTWEAGISFFLDFIYSFFLILAVLGLVAVWTFL